MAALSNQLYLVTRTTTGPPDSPVNTTIIYGGISTNPYRTPTTPTVLASGPGVVTGINVYHKSQVRQGRHACCMT